jgi:hypothetical protein
MLSTGKSVRNEYFFSFNAVFFFTMEQNWHCHSTTTQSMSPHVTRGNITF